MSKAGNKILNGCLTELSILFLSPLLVMWMWNGCVCDMFHLSQFTYWQFFFFLWILRLVSGNFFSNIRSMLNNG